MAEGHVPANTGLRRNAPKILLCWKNLLKIKIKWLEALNHKYGSKTEDVWNFETLVVTFLFLLTATKSLEGGG